MTLLVPNSIKKILILALNPYISELLTIPSMYPHKPKITFFRRDDGIHPAADSFDELFKPVLQEWVDRIRCSNASAAKQSFSEPRPSGHNYSTIITDLSKDVIFPNLSTHTRTQYLSNQYMNI